MQGAAVDHGSSGGTVAVNAIGAGAEHGNIVSRYLFGAGESELLVAPARAAIAYGDSYLAAGDQTDARHFAAKLPKTVEQVRGGLVVGPIVAGVIDFDGETGAHCVCGSLIDGNFIREHGPPARTNESRVIGLGRLVERVLAKE